MKNGLRIAQYILLMHFLLVISTIGKEGPTLGSLTDTVAAVGGLSFIVSIMALQGAAATPASMELIVFRALAVVFLLLLIGGYAARFSGSPPSISQLQMMLIGTFGMAFIGAAHALK